MRLLAAATFAGASCIHYQTPMLGAMAAEFGADNLAVGWIPTLTFGGFLVGILFLVPLGDRMDKRRLILTQTACAIAALLAAAAAPTLATEAALGFVIGVSAGFAQTIVPMVAELAPAQARGRSVAAILTALFLGILFARIAGGLVAAYLGWRWMFVLAAGMLVALFPALWRLLPRMPPKTTLPYPQLIASLFGLLRSYAAMRRVVLTQFLAGICYGGFWATIAILLASHGLGSTAAGLIAIPGAAGILIARPAGRWLDSRGPGPVVAGGLAVLLAAYAVIALGAWWVAALFAGAVLLDCGLRAAMVANQTVINSLVPEARSRSNTIFGMSVWSGNAGGAFLASTALAWGGWLAVCAISALAAGTALGLHLRAWLGTRRG